MKLPTLIHSPCHINPINTLSGNSKENKPLIDNINNVKNSPELIPRPPTHTTSSLLKKLAIYREYARLGNNPEDARDRLAILQSKISDKALKENKHIQKIIEILPALLCLESELLTTDAWQKTQKNQFDEINKRETIARELIHAFSMLPEHLLNESIHQQLYSNTQHRKVLTEELINGALQRLLTGRETEAERDVQLGKIRELITSPPHTMSIPLRERIEYFFSIALAKLHEPAEREFAELNQQLQRTIKNARYFLISSRYKSPCTSTDFLHCIKQCLEQLEKLVSGPEQGIRRMPASQSKIAQPGKDKWLAPDGIRLSVPARKLADTAANVAHHATNFFDYARPFNKPAESVPLQPLTRFDQMPKETRQMCVALKEMSTPTRNMAEELQEAAVRLEKAVKAAKNAGMRAIQKDKTPEQALLTELFILTEETPKTQLILAIQAVSSTVLRAQALASPRAMSPTEKAFMAHIRQANASIVDAASQLNTTIQLIENDLLQQSISDGLSRVIKITGNISDELNYALESTTGVSLHSNREWLDKQLNLFITATHAITRIIAKGDTRFPISSYAAERQLANATRFCEIHLSVLPVLNEVEKIRVASEMLDMGLREVIKNKRAACQPLKTATDKCARINLDSIQEAGTSVVRVLRGHDIHVYQHGDEYTGTPITLGKVLGRLSDELLEVTGRLQTTSELVAWAAEENAQSISLALTGIKKRLNVIKTEIKDAVQAATGTRLHNNSLEGMIAKDAGEWLAALRKEWSEDVSRQETEKRTEEIIQHLSAALVTEDVSQGQLFRKRISLALQDAEGDGVPWPLTPQALLRTTKSKKEYLQAWAEKRLAYGMLYNLLIHSNPIAMFSLHKNMLSPSLRLMNLALTPIRVEMTRRAMKKVRPEEPHPSALIEEYESREKYQMAVRFASMLSPQLPKTLAAIGIATAGIVEGGEYRDRFIKRAIVRLPGDLFWIAGFATGREFTRTCRKYAKKSSMNNNSTTESDTIILTNPDQYSGRVKASSEKDEPEITRLKRSASREGWIEERQNTENDRNMYFHPHEFNKAMNAWLKDKGQTTTDPNTIKYIKIFTNTPLNADIKKTERMVSNSFESRVSYIFLLLSEFNLTAWPFDFHEVKTNIEFYSYEMDVKNKLTLLDNLYLPDNPNFKELIKKDYSDTFKYYSEKEKIKNYILLLKHHLRAISENKTPLQRFPILDSTNETKKIISKNEDKIKKIKEKELSIENKKNLRDLLSSHRLATVNDKLKDIIEVHPPSVITKETLNSITHYEKEKLDQLIVDKLRKYIPNSTTSDLDRKFTVRYIEGSYPGTSGGHTDMVFTLRQLLLGEADRSVFIMPGGARLMQIKNGEPQIIYNFISNKNSRLSVADDVMRDIKNSVNATANDLNFKLNFKAISLGKIINALHKHSNIIFNNNNIYQEIVNGFMDGVITPEPVLFNDKIIPNILSLSGEDYRIIVSIETGELILFNVLEPISTLPEFIKKHLPEIQKNNCISPDGKPINYISRPNKNITDPYSAIFNANIDKKYSDLNGIIYTSAERNFKMKNSLEKVLIQSSDLLLIFATLSLSKTASTFIALLSALGTGLGNIYLDEQVASQADRYEDLKTAEQNVMLGKLFMVVNISIPLLSHIRGQNSSREVISDLISSATNKTSKPIKIFYPKAIDLEEALISEESTIGSLLAKDQETINNELQYIAADITSTLPQIPEENINFLDTIKVTPPNIAIKKNLYLERESYNYLLTHGVQAHSKPSFQINMGFYIDEDGHITFPVGDKTFSIHQNNIKKNSFDIATNNNKKLTIYLDDNFLVRIKNNFNEETQSYTEVSGCRYKRTPGSTSFCSMTFMSNDLDQVLSNSKMHKKLIDSNQNNEDILFYEDRYFPNLYINNKNENMYFLHRGKYFNAEFVEPNSADNTTDNTMLRLFFKGNVLQNKNTIAIIASERKGDIIHLKTDAELLSKNTNINKIEIMRYFRNRRFIGVKNIKDISGAVDQKKTSGNNYIPEIQKNEDPVLLINMNDKSIKKVLYPERIMNNKQNNITINPLSHINESSPYYLRIAKVKITHHVDMIRDKIIPDVLKSLKNMNQNTINYLRAVLYTDDIAFINKAAKTFCSRLEKLKKHLNADKIYISSIDKKAINTDSSSLSEQQNFLPVLNEQERSSGGLAFLLPDNSGRIVINEDKLGIPFPHHPDPKIRVARPPLNLLNLLLHEYSHIDNMTTDIAYFPVKNGAYELVLDSINDMSEKIKSNTIRHYEHFDELNNSYFKNIPEYSAIKNKLKDPTALHYIFEKDPGYLSHLLFNNADSFSLLTTDLYKISQSVNPLQPPF
ncbi:hypothetical protein [Cedecea davisae]|uniref:hypothetical protein n=1 Tax=Cedecea davisae TaxID=158484 RepID=UPI001D0A261D|nr:hypothetical protein [Cedecea davisae]